MSLTTDPAKGVPIPQMWYFNSHDPMTIGEELGWCLDIAHYKDSPTVRNIYERFFGESIYGNWYREGEPPHPLLDDGRLTAMVAGRINGR